MPTFSLIICTYNRVDYLKETIESIWNHFGNRFEYEMIVVDNNSTDGTAQVAQQYAHIPVFKYYKELKQGLSHARNRGIEEAKNEVLVFLDDDIDIESNYLDRGNALFGDASVQIAGGKVLPFKVEVPPWLPRKFYYLVSIFDLGNERILTKKLMGANYAMRKDAALKIGWYNPELGRKGNTLTGGEEIDYLDRAKNLGYNIWYDPGLIVYHKINNKLNKEYVFTYSFQLGRSERIIDLQQSKVKYGLKVAKAFAMLFAYLVYGSYTPDQKQRAYFKINQQYSLGYLSGN
ncbi:glycosyltransferase family 2 protein [Telluribacter sp.]|jgi:glycosyltransferase involved in cell wall biosynthesis|uniref:glycosyltransferase family 2 protein n=1 Tax=Telluribacter sp. TaxID=1978767 RepID=UPI002E143FFC|nr:glycosyltransferase [Telluribacter sp.]